jgi:hypothetical protein
MWLLIMALVDLGEASAELMNPYLHKYALSLHV